MRKDITLGACEQFLLKYFVNDRLFLRFFNNEKKNVQSAN